MVDTLSSLEVAKKKLTPQAKLSNLRLAKSYNSIGSLALS